MHVDAENRSRLAHFVRQLFEMLLAMMLAMFAGGALFVGVTGIPP